MKIEILFRHVFVFQKIICSFSKLILS